MPRTTLLRKQVTQTGTIQPHAGPTAPEGHLLCDGSIVNIADYPKLYAVIGTSWGYGNNDGLTFHLPDLRGRMLRGQDAGAGRDPDRLSRTASNAGGNTGDAVGSVQGDAVRNISGQFNGGPTYSTTNANGVFRETTTPVSTQVNTGRAYGHTYVTIDLSRQVPTGGDNRPINANVNYVIKAI